MARVAIRNSFSDTIWSVVAKYHLPGCILRFVIPVHSWGKGIVWSELNQSEHRWRAELWARD